MQTQIDLGFNYIITKPTLSRGRGGKPGVLIRDNRAASKIKWVARELATHFYVK